MRLRTKLIFYMIIPTLLLGVMGIVGIFSLRYVGQAAGRILDENYRSIQAARNMERILRDIESDFLRASPIRGADDTRLGAFHREFRRCEQAISEPDEKQLIKNVQRQWIQLAAALKGVPAPGLADVHHYFAKIFKDLESIIAVNERAMSQREIKTRRAGRWMEVAVGASFLATLLALLVFAFVAARRISGPITEISDRLHGALVSDHPQEREESEPSGSEAPRADEIARLRRELESLLARLAHFESEQNRRLSDLQGRLASIINEVLEGLLLLDEKRRVLSINRVAREILGPEVTEGAVLALDRLSDDVRTSLSPIIDGAVENEQDLEEVRRKHGDELRHYRPRILSVRSSEQQSLSHLVIFWDVTEQARFDEARRRFISTLSHQLKTPITSLALSVNMLNERLRKDGAPPEHELLEIAKDNCAVLSSLVSELIVASKEMRPNLSYEKKSVDVREVLEQVLRPLGKIAEDKGIELDTNVTHRELLVLADSVKLSWVLTNVLGNAVRHTPAGGRIAIDASTDGKLVRIRISDTGMGIPRDQLESIFLPFVSLRPDPEPGSHGLGLAIAREIMTRHGGTIRAESRSGEGATFWINLPHEGGERHEPDTRG